jgi:hypothetical protein
VCISYKISIFIVSLYIMQAFSSILTKEERRILIDPKTVVRNVIKKSPSVFSSSPSNDQTPLEFHFRASSPDSLNADSQLKEYLHNNFSAPHARDLTNSCNMLIEKLYKVSF